MIAVAELSGNRIAAAYEDKSLRLWQMQPGHAWKSKAIMMLDHKAEWLQLTTHGHLAASGDGNLSIIDITAEASLKCKFQTKSRFRSIILGTRSTLCVEEQGGGVARVPYREIPANIGEMTSVHFR